MGGVSAESGSAESEFAVAGVFISLPSSKREAGARVVEHTPAIWRII